MGCEEDLSCLGCPSVDVCLSQAPARHGIRLRAMRPWIKPRGAGRITAGISSRLHHVEGFAAASPVGNAMPPAVAHLKSRLGAARAREWQLAGSIALVVALHAAAAVIMVETEADVAPKAAFILTWGVLNFLLVAVLRRPVAAAALSLAMIAVLIKLSQLKHSVLFMTVNFVDLMIIDTETFAFLFKVYPGLRQAVTIAVLTAIPVLLLVWRLDSLRVRLRAAAAGCAVCVAGLSALANAAPRGPYEEIYRYGYVSKFGRSGGTAAELRD